MESRCSSPSSEDVGCVRWRRRGIAMPISISSSSFLNHATIIGRPLLPPHEHPKQSKQTRCNPCLLDLGPPRTASVRIARFQQDVLEFLVVKNAKNPENEKNGRKDKGAFRFCSAP